MKRADVQKFASDAGFGANLRNTHAVKLERFAEAVEKAVARELARQTLDLADNIRHRCANQLGDVVAECIDSFATGMLAISEGRAP